MSAFAWDAAISGAYWIGDKAVSDPSYNRQEKHLWKSFGAAFSKRDPDRKKPRPPLTIDVLAAFLSELGIKGISDLHTCSLWALQRAALLLVSHNAGLRFCEVQSGMKIADANIYPDQVTIKVAMRPGDKKLKSRPGRVTHHIISESHLCAAFTFRVYCERVHSCAISSDAILWPFISAGRPNHINRRKPFGALAYKALLKTLALESGAFTPEESQRVTHHCLRSGALTDGLAAKFPKEYLCKQMGWSPKSNVWEVYHRPPQSRTWNLAYPAGLLLLQASSSINRRNITPSLPGEKFPSIVPFTG